MLLRFLTIRIRLISVVWNSNCHLLMPCSPMLWKCHKAIPRHTQCSYLCACNFRIYPRLFHKLGIRFWRLLSCVLLGLAQWQLVGQISQCIRNGNAYCVQDGSLFAFLATKSTWTANVWPAAAAASNNVCICHDLSNFGSHCGSLSQK